MAEQIPVFIGGAGRSGTTLIVDMLGLHPSVSPIYETEFVLNLGRLLFGSARLPVGQQATEIHRYMDEWTRPLPMRPHEKRAHEQFHHGPNYILFDRAFAMERSGELIASLGGEDVMGAFRRFILRLFEEHCRRDAKTNWVNKTPRYVLALPALRELFPNLRFIHCVRDGRDTACSAITRDWGPRGIQQAAQWWVDNVRSGVQFGAQFPQQYLQVRYEDVLRGPRSELERMLAWIGLPLDAQSILSKYQEGRVRLDPSRTGVWKTIFTQEDLRAFSATAGEMLAHFGYE